MPSTTANYAFRKPAGSDAVSVALDIAGNMDAIDAAIDGVADAVAGKAATVHTHTASQVTDLAVVTANTQTDSYTLVLADAGKVVEMNKATANNLTVPTNATVAFPVGTVIELFQLGAGQTTVVAAGGVTINSSGGKLKLTGQYSGASLRKRATDAWVLVGDIAT